MCSGIAGASGCCRSPGRRGQGRRLADGGMAWDGRSRAWQQAMRIASVPASPVVLSDGRGGTVVIEEADDARAGRLARGVAASFGVCAVALYCMTAGQARRRRSAAPCRVRSRSAGRRRTTGAGSAHCAMELEAVVLIEGKVVDVQRGTGDDAVGGSVTVQADRGVGCGRAAGAAERVLLALEDGRARLRPT